MAYSSADKEITSNGDDTSMMSCNLITKEEADRIYQRLVMLNMHSINNIKRNWTSEELKLLEFAVDKFCQTTKRHVSSLTTKDWKNIA